MEEDTYSSDKGYGKRPLWRWILIYAVIGIIVYGLIYYFVLARRGTTYSPGNTTIQPQQTAQPVNPGY